MGLRLRQLKFVIKDHWRKLLLLAVVVGMVLWLARAVVFTMSFDR